MVHEIRSISIADNTHIAEIGALLEEVNRHDGTGYTLDMEDDFRKEKEYNTFLLTAENRLVSAINLFAPSRREAEITGFTHPDFRQRGFFTALRLTMEKELRRRGIPSQLFVCDRLFAPGKHILKRLDAEYEFSEYLMELSSSPPSGKPLIPGMTLSRSKPAERPILTRIMSEAFGDPLPEVETRANEFFGSPKRTIYTIGLDGEIAGMIGVYQEGQVDYIHGFCLDAAHRGRGLGKAALVRTAALCRESDPFRKIHLEVETENENALSIYLKAGFQTLSVFDYYRRANPEAEPG